MQAFEVLSCLNPPLPDFSRSNWQSTIRHYASAHDEYADLERWHGSEMADITYDDSGGVLTSLLVDKGYLSCEVWAAKRPTYYIEVKSTTGPRENAFFMSKDQYALVGERVVVSFYRLMLAAIGERVFEWRFGI